MLPSSKQPRKKRGQEPKLEPLEGRQLLSTGQGSTFAIVPGTVSTAGQLSNIPFKIDPSQFTAGRGGKILLGIDVASDPSTSIKPQIAGVKQADGRSAGALHRSMYTMQVIKAKSLASPMSSAVLVSVPVPRAGQAAQTYTLQVRGNFGSTGDYLAGFYLPGDVNGDGTVNKTDLETIVKDLGATPSSSKYTFDADVNRDGKISGIDLKYATMNMGVSTTVSPIIGVNLDPATDGPLQSRVTSSNPVHFTGTATPGATVTFTEVNGNSPGASATVDSTGKYSIWVPLGSGSNTFQVATSDAFGQSITGQIAPVTYTLNPPQVINNPSQLTSSTHTGGSGSTS
jgi:hypothetical protein